MADLRTENTQHVRSLTTAHHAHLYLWWPVRPSRPTSKPSRAVAANSRGTAHGIQWQPYGAVAGRLGFSEYYRFSLGMKCGKSRTPSGECSQGRKGRAPEPIETSG